MAAAKNRAASTYAALKKSLMRRDWAEVERRFRSFAKKSDIPEWFADEVVFQGMKLWQAERPGDMLRHFAWVLDRVSGENNCLDTEDAREVDRAFAAAAA
jgi:hypothetical protein